MRQTGGLKPVSDFKKILIAAILVGLTNIANATSNGLYANLQLGDFSELYTVVVQHSVPEG